MPSKTVECLLVTVAVVALTAYFVGQRPNIPVTPVSPPYVGGDNPLDVSRYPGWPKLETALDAIVRREVKNNAEIASSLGAASVEYLSKATNRYLYLAIVHASVLGAARSSSESEDVSALLREKVDSLELEKKDLLAEHHALVKENDVLANKLTASKYNDEELQKAQASIEDLQQQLEKVTQEKKTILDLLKGVAKE